MKIAIVNTWAISKKAVGGTERFVMDLAKTFANSGNEVDVYMFSGKTHKEDEVNYININIFNMVGEADEYIVQEAFGNFSVRKNFFEKVSDIFRRSIYFDIYSISTNKSQRKYPFEVPYM